MGEEEISIEIDLSTLENEAATEQMTPLALGDRCAVTFFGSSSRQDTAPVINRPPPPTAQIQARSTWEPWQVVFITACFVCLAVLVGATIALLTH